MKHLVEVWTTIQEKISLWHAEQDLNQIPFVADGDSQEFQEVSRPVSSDKDYLTGS